MKTASEELKAKNSIPPITAAENTASQPGPEDGRDQNIKPDSNSYDPDNGKLKKRIDHNKEVYRSGQELLEDTDENSPEQYQKK